MLESNGSTFPWAFGRAADPAKWTPPADDSSLGILREVFGNIVDFVIGNGVSAANLSENNTVIASGFEVFNTAILFLAMIFVAYSSIMGVINTAHDGEFERYAYRC